MSTEKTEGAACSPARKSATRKESNSTASTSAAVRLANILRGIDARSPWANDKLTKAAAELERLDALASAPVAPTQPARIERKVYKGTPEHREYLAARFPRNGGSPSNSFEWQGHRWAYYRTSFNDAGEYDLIYRNTPEAAPVAPAPLQQGEYLPLPPAVGLAYFPESELINANSIRSQTAHNEDGVYDEFEKEIFTADQMRAYVDADRAARRAPSAQDAADWLVGAGVVTDDMDLAQRLNIGHNRAERLFAAASARQKGGEPA